MLLYLFCNFTINMKNIEIDGLHFELFLSIGDIEKKVLDLANQLKRIYKDEWPVCLIVLNGAVVFAHQLLKHLDPAIEFSLIKVNSYDGVNSTGKVVMDHFPYDIIKNQRILLIEDIVDTGSTLSFLKKELKKNGAKGIECITLLFKKNKYEYNIPPEYIGFTIGDEFVVGYGMDLDQKGRDLKNIYKSVIHQN